MTDAITSQTKARERVKRTGRVGTVVSDKGDKTIKVKYEYTAKHPMYGKYMRRTTMLHAHDERNEAKTGDVVELMACRRMSKTKFWRLVQIVRAD